MDNTKIEQTAKSWLKEPFDKETQKEVQRLIDTNNITESFYKNLAFGTGGMRGIMGAGTNRINKYTLGKNTQGISNYLKKIFPNKSIKVAIAYDCRHNSDTFAKGVADVFSANGIKVYLFEELRPTPELSFAVRHLGCDVGIVLTASHNPPEYNGYKAYWEDGGQVTHPMDKTIVDYFKGISANDTIPFIDFDKGIESGHIKWIDKDVEDKYFDKIKNYSLNKSMCKEYGSKIKISYTPIHGTGLAPCLRALNDLGLNNVEVVKEQAKPDHKFPTVSSPNPENPSALKLAVDLMIKTNADITLGTDPDTDRVGLALKNKNNKIIYISGNQIGTLLLNYIIESKKESKTLKKNSYFLKSIVTTRLQDTMAKSNNIKTINTLTGFKWMCKEMRSIEESTKEDFLFATEESFGYLTHPFCRDKDGVSSIAIISEMTLYYKLKGLTLLDQLDIIYEKYGYYFEQLFSINYKGQSGSIKINNIMQSFRNFNKDKLLNNTITTINDYNKEGLALPKSNMLEIVFDNGDIIFLRPSGTEPKIKFYILLHETEGNLNYKKEISLKRSLEIKEYITNLCEEIDE